MFSTPQIKDLNQDTYYWTQIIGKILEESRVKTVLHSTIKKKKEELPGFKLFQAIRTTLNRIRNYQKKPNHLQYKYEFSVTPTYVLKDKQIIKHIVNGLQTKFMTHELRAMRQ